MYRSIYPTIVERGQAKLPGEAGSGVRNLLVLALFHAFARSFKGEAVLGIEEPELFLHPHAQRSLMGQFESLIADGNQIFISSHSATFLDITRPERIVVVECCKDDEQEICTHVRTTSVQKLLEARRGLHPDRQMTEISMRAFLQNVRTTEMAEPYFARLVIVAEGASEREALPLLCEHLGLRLDDEGISIVAAGGKTVIDTLVQVYQAHELPLYVIFDNDEGQKAQDRDYNKVICRLLDIAETAAPAACIRKNYAVLSGNWEENMRTDLDAVEIGLYDRLVAEARQVLGLKPDKNKPLVARYVAEQMIEKGTIPNSVKDIVACLKQKVGLGLPSGSPLSELDDILPWMTNASPVIESELDDQLPF